MSQRDGFENESRRDELLIRARWTASIDRNRLEEWLGANFLEDQFVEIVDRKTGDVLAMNGEDPDPFICPSCGELADSIIHSKGEKRYTHGVDDLCEVEP